MHVRHLFFAIFFALILCLQVPLGQAQQGSPVAADTTIVIGQAHLGRAERAAADFKEQIEKIATDVAVPGIANAVLADKRNELEQIRLAVLAEQSNLVQPVADVAQQIASLGEAPKEGAGEDEALAQKRKSLEQRKSSLEAAGKQLGLLALRAEQISANIAATQRQTFIEHVFEPGKSILNPVLWIESLNSIPAFFARLAALSKNWSLSDPENAAAGKPTSGALTLGVFILAAICVFVLWRHLRTRSRDVEYVDNLYRVWRAVRVPLFTAAIMVTAFALIHLILQFFGPPPPRISRLVDAILRGAFVAAFATALSRGIFRPTAPALRLVDIGDWSATRLHKVVAAIAFLYGIDEVVSALADIMFLPIAFTVGWSAFISMWLTILIIASLVIVRRARGFAEDDKDTPGSRLFYFDWTRYLFHAIWLVVAFAGLSLIAGYISLSHFVVSQLVRTAVIVATLYLVHHLADALVSSALQTYSYTGRFLRHTLGLGETAVGRLGLLFSTIVDLSLLIVGVPLVLLQWTLTWIDLKSWATTAVVGFKVGDITIAPANIALGLTVLLAGLVLARLFSSWLDKRVLARASLDTGVRNSIYSGARYAAIVLAAGFALSVAGVNFSNLAIVAGALSVGIGFGLQSIVNNFVSGLILLAERPIKVGDWISVSGGEGTVKQINVRSTEIETFDRCTVFVPNSSLISESVSNWYHGSRIGRVRVAVGVGYDSDPEQVEQILLSCAREGDHIISSPEPFVLFMDFGASSLDFELRVYIDDVAWVGIVGSDLRYKIFKSLKAAGIEIPFPQRDLHVRSVDAGTIEAFAPPAKAKAR